MTKKYGINKKVGIKPTFILYYLLDKYPEEEPLNTQDSEYLKYLVNKTIDSLSKEDIPNEEYLDKNDAEIIYYDNIGNNLYVEYLIVNPMHQGRGVATNFYNTIKNNPEFFGGDEYTNLIHLSVNHNNIHSRKSVLKNGFKRMTPTHCGDIVNSIYFCRIQSKYELKEENENERI